MNPNAASKESENCVYVLHVMTVDNQIAEPGRLFAIDWEWPMDLPTEFLRQVCVADEIDHNGIAQRAYAFQAPGEWLPYPGLSGEFVTIRKIEQDEIFVSDTKVLLLQASTITELPGSFACDVFGVAHGRQYANAVDYLEQAALDKLITGLAEDYFLCYGRDLPDETVEIAGQELGQVDLTRCDEKDILALATNIIPKVPPPDVRT